MKIIIIIAVIIIILILERILKTLKNPHLVIEKTEPQDYKVTHKNGSNTIINYHFHDNRKYTYIDNSKNYIDKSQHTDNSIKLNIQNLNADLRRQLNQHIDFSRNLALTSFEQNLLSPKTINQLDKPTIPVLANFERKQLKP